MPFLRPLLIMLAVLTAMPLLAASPQSPRPSVILIITIDTTRADRMGFLGSAQGLTPQLDALARQSVIFKAAYAHVPLTTPSHATILTGTYPQFNHVRDMGDPLATDLPYLPEILRHQGYITAAFVGGSVLDPAAGSALGFNRGFDTYDAGFHKRRAGEDRYHSVERRAEVVIAHGIEWLDKHAQRPVFLWIHLYDPHDPYDPPEPYKSRYPTDPYAGEIAYSDFAAGQFLAALKKAGLYDNALIAVMADHGEALGEHGEQTHGVFLYDETIHVPLLMKLPAQRLAGTTVSTRAGLADVAPTLLQILGVPAPAAMQGTSLLPRMEAVAQRKPAEDSPLYAESEYGHDAFGWSPLNAWRAGKYLFVQAPRRELYDQHADPAAQHDLATKSPAIADTMASELDRFRERTSSKATLKPELSPAAAENLRALGYVSSENRATHPGNDGDRKTIDPKDKDRIEFANLMHAALIDVEEDRFPDAIPKLERAIQIDPQFGSAHMELGSALLHVNALDKALPTLQKAVQLLPDSATAHEKLGEALVKTKDWPTAASEFEAAIAHNPNAANLHVNLAGVYERLNRIPDATAQYRKAVELAPDDFRANLLTGRLLGMHGDAPAALPYLQKAVALDPNSPDAHQFLGNIYGAMGRAEEAQQEKSEAQRLRARPKP